MKRVHADFGLLSVALIWGLTFPVVKVSLSYISPFAFNSIRFLIATALFLPFLRRREVKAGVAIGFATFLGYAFQTVGLEYTSATNAGFITSLYVVLTPLVAYILYREEIFTFEILSVFLAFLGVYFLTGYTSFNHGDLLVLLCSVTFAFEIAMISKYSKELNPLSLAGWQVFAVGLFSALIAPFSTKKFEINEIVAISLVVTAILATFIAKVLQNYFQAYTKSSDAGIILSTEGVFSHAFGWIMLGEKLTFSQYFGVFLISAAVVIVSLKGDKSQNYRYRSKKNAEI